MTRKWEKMTTIDTVDFLKNIKEISTSPFYHDKKPDNLTSEIIGEHIQKGRCGVLITLKYEGPDYQKFREVFNYAAKFTKYQGGSICDPISNYVNPDSMIVKKQKPKKGKHQPKPKIHRPIKRMEGCWEYDVGDKVKDNKEEKKNKK